MGKVACFKYNQYQISRILYVMIHWKTGEFNYHAVERVVRHETVLVNGELKALSVVQRQRILCRSAMFFSIPTVATALCLQKYHTYLILKVIKS